jgi:hypothetical protein
MLIITSFNGNTFVIILPSCCQYTLAKEDQRSYITQQWKFVLDNMEDTQEKGRTSLQKVMESNEDLLVQFRMENRENLEKAGSTHTMIEYVKTRRHMSMKSIEAK